MYKGSLVEVIRMCHSNYHLYFKKKKKRLSDTSTVCGDNAHDRNKNKKIAINAEFRQFN